MKSIRTAHVCHAAAVVAAVTALSAPAHADPKMLTDNAGMTVYTFDKDSAGKSACYGGCAAAWPPVAPGSMAGGPELSAISRDDGSRQAAYQGKPLYLFGGDAKPGDTYGDNVQNVWHVVPTGSARKAAPSNPAATTNSGFSYGY